MKSIHSLVGDIYARVSNPKPVHPDNMERLCEAIASGVSQQIGQERSPFSLRLSNLGSPCDRKAWYQAHEPERGEPLPPYARLKFLYGTMLEALLLFLAREAGHTVTDEQREVSIDGVKGHIDGKIDGHVVDCKSASPYSYQKFKDHALVSDDPFGYLVQLGSYGEAVAAEDGQHTGENHFLAIEKVLGHIHLDTWERSKVDYKSMVKARTAMLVQLAPPARCYSDVPDGKSGNRKLGVACSYCEFRHHCWPGLRTFIYARGPVYLTKVVRLPDVQEVP